MSCFLRAVDGSIILAIDGSPILVEGDCGDELSSTASSGGGRKRVRTLFNDWEDLRAARLTHAFLETVEDAIERPTRAKLTEVRKEARKANLVSLLDGVPKPQDVRVTDKTELIAKLETVADKLRALAEAQDAELDDEEALIFLI